MTGPAIDPRTAAGVAHIARLSRLAMTPSELEVMAGHMSKILDAVSALDRLDTAGVEAGLHDDAATALRADVVVASLGAEEALRAAPKKQPGGFEVPAVISEGS